EFDLVPLDSGRRWNGASVADFDGNGIDDILLLPRLGEPALFMASAGATTPVYRDLAYTLGLRGGATSGAVAYDFGGSSLADLYMGRLGTGQFLYKNVGTSTQNWLDVDLSTVGNSCSSLFGTEVVVSSGGRQWRKWVDGGSGRGGQEPGKLRFYLGDATEPVSVTVNYPSGDSDAASGVPLGGSFISVEDTPVTLKVGTKASPDPRFTCELRPGTMDWVFRWRTVGIKGDGRQDAVTIENYLGYENGSSCYMGFDQGTPLVLRPGDAGVTTEIYWDGTDWQHELRWSGLPCMPDCQYRFKVTSGIGNGVTSTGPTRVMPAINFCLPE
ncbi:MAG: ASPIC/UnbV domain-containing protein, partial [Gammaproteobacteria bacterium]|nr:ASPIC/UnbV domain-containing protein [Gammaproteobacteria bacterium]